METATRTGSLSLCHCPKCSKVIGMTEEDENFNKIRLNEQKEFRKPGAEFKMNFKYTCGCCGMILVERTLCLRG